MLACDSQIDFWRITSSADTTSLHPSHQLKLSIDLHNTSCLTLQGSMLLYTRLKHEPGIGSGSESRPMHSRDYALSEIIVGVLDLGRSSRGVTFGGEFPVKLRLDGSQPNLDLATVKRSIIGQNLMSKYSL